MKKVLSSTLNAYQKYRAFTKRNRIYKVGKYLLAAIFAVYGLILVFPQFLFAHEVSHRDFKVYSRQPLDESVYKVLDSAEARLENSPLYDKNLTERIFISDTFSFYAFLNPRGKGSFANTTTGIGIMINKADVAGNLVYRNAEQDNKRSLSNVIAHEVTHILIQNKLGLIKSFVSLPRWKAEGYCEYVAGETTISFEEGVRRWKANPNDDSKYLYFKYHQMAKYLLDDEKISVEELFNRDFDEKELAAKVFSKISQN
ncbi:MAG: hypothetical protein NVSMB56_10540 [Pyrinomonadaceae bacterium]